MAALRGNYGDSENKNLSTNNVHLYQKMAANGQDSTYQTNRFNLTPRKNYDINARFTYNEPIAKGLLLQINYEYQHNYTKSDRSTYDFSSKRFWLSQVVVRRAYPRLPRLGQLFGKARQPVRHLS